MTQMAQRTKTRGKYAPQPKAPPVPETKPAPEPLLPSTAIKVPDREGDELNAALAQYGMRVPALGEFGEGGFRLDEGVIPRRWARESATVMALARRLATKKEEYERVSVNRDEAREAAQKERAAAKAKMYRGMIKLNALLAEMGAGAPSLGRARKAIERAHMIHKKFHFGPKEVEQARKILREMPAAAKNSLARVEGAGGISVRQPSAPVGVIRVLIKENPHRAGSVQHERMGVLMAHGGKPAATYLTAGGCRHKLKHALDQGWVHLDQTAGATAAPSSPASSGATRDPEKTARAEASKLAKATGITKKVVRRHK